MLLGMWDEASQTLTVRRPNGAIYIADGRQIIAGGHQVLGVETVGNEVHVLTAPARNGRPARRVKFSDGGLYKGSEAVA